MALSASIGALGSILSGVASGIMAGHGQYRAYQYNKLLQKQQYKLQQKGLIEGPSNARQGYENAGYNPILAINSGGQFAGAGNAGGVGAISGSMPDLGDSASNAYRAYNLEKQSMANQTAQTEANVGLANAQAENAIQQSITEETKRRNLEFDSMMKDAHAHSINTKLPYEVRKLNEEIYNTMQDSELKRAISSIQAYDAETRRITANASATNANTMIYDAKTRRMTGQSEHNYRQVMANLEGARYTLDKIKAPIQMTRDVYAGVGAGLAGSSYFGTNAKQYRSNNSGFDYYRDYDNFRTRRH